jgi:hypothetical protein
MDERPLDEAFARVRGEPALLGPVYQAAEARRSAIDQMMWQAPALSLTAQAFLLTVGLQDATQPAGRMLAGALGLGVALASMQLLAKHRLHEVRLSLWLSHFERDTALPNLNDRDERHRFDREGDTARLGRVGMWLAGDDRSSFRWWLWTLAVFGAADVFVVALGLLAAVGLWNPLAG